MFVADSDTSEFEVGDESAIVGAYGTDLRT
jgi:hypothetical protein